MAIDREQLVLFGKYIDGVLTSEETDRLLALLTERPDLRKEFWKNIETDFILMQKSREIMPTSSSDWTRLLPLGMSDSATRPINLGQTEPAQTLRERLTRLCRFQWTRNRDSGRPWLRGVFALAAALLLVVITAIGLLWCLLPFRSSLPDFDGEARVRELVDAVWAEDDVEFQRGQVFNENHFMLKSGLVQLEMKNGTTLILQGPTDLTIHDAMHAFCQSGKVTARVTRKAIGYEITTPNGNIIDRGTEFFIDARADTTQVAVLQGKVDYLSPAKEVFSLFANEAIELNLSKMLKKIPFPPPSDYIDTSGFNTTIKEKATLARAEKTQEDAILDADPNLLVRLDFADLAKGRIGNKSQRGRDLVSFARSTGVKTTEGPLAETKAALFRARDAYAEMTLPGRYDALAIEAVVRIDRLENEGNTIMASTEFLREEGTFVLQLLKDGRLQVQITPPGGEGDRIFSARPIKTSGIKGIWQTYRVELDSRKKNIRFFVGGHLVTQTAWKNASTLRPGPLTIGNEIKQENWSSSSALGGAISELKIFELP
ncbi:MAG: FecR family protein [Planctomycetia bacterium]|nr:FecR family protein [Planctomycetia bacterium]